MGDADDSSQLLLGTWESTDVFGNTALDWTQAMKDGSAQLAVTFSASGELTFELFTRNPATGERTDVTANFRHVVASRGRYTLSGTNILHIEGDNSGIQWTYQHEEGDTLRFRLEGAKRFGRCKGVDVIYFKRVS